MESHCFWWLAVSSVLYLAVYTSPVSGKCYGKWAIHACLGGNGKRSGPPTDRAQMVKTRSLLLKKLLTEGSESLEPPYSDLSSNIVEDLTEDREGSHFAEEIEHQEHVYKLVKALRKLIYDRRLPGDDALL